MPGIAETTDSCCSKSRQNDGFRGSATCEATYNTTKPTVEATNPLNLRGERAAAVWVRHCDGCNMRKRTAIQVSGGRESALTFAYKEESLLHFGLDAVGHLMAPRAEWHH